MAIKKTPLTTRGVSGPLRGSDPQSCNCTLVIGRAHGPFTGQLPSFLLVQSERVELIRRDAVSLDVARR
jgi:hypothetical protein